MRQDNSILQELKTIAPGLADLPKPGNGTVPEGYFSELQDAVWAGIQFKEEEQSATEELKRLAPVLADVKILAIEHEPIDFSQLQSSVLKMVQEEASAQEELQAIAPALAVIPGINVANHLPEGYFRDMQNRVVEQAGLSKPGRRFHFSFNKNTRYAWSAAASVLLLLVAGWWWMQPIAETNTPASANASLALTEEEILTYLTLDQEGLDAQMLLALDHSMLDAPATEQIAPEKDAAKKYNNKNTNSKSKSGTSIEEEELNQLLDELDADDLENLF